MNQIHIGVVVPVMENGRIHTFQVQYTMTTQKMCSDQDMNVIVRESEGKHILHTVLYSENFWLFHNPYFNHCLSFPWHLVILFQAFCICYIHFLNGFWNKFPIRFFIGFWNIQYGVHSLPNLARIIVSRQIQEKLKV